MIKYSYFILFLLFAMDVFSQGSPPWERPLKIAGSSDGITFTPPAVFQDSAGVPSAVKWKGDTIACVFQWFRQPMNSPTWDRVAVKFSYDNGFSWSQPVPVIVNGIPPNYQRPFDPTLVVINSDSMRIFFSSSDGMPTAGLDSTINTYSAVTTDGINYTFEPGARFDHPTNRVIDPAVIIFNGQWNYLAPIGAPQDGAFHCTSQDGLTFTQQADYSSDPMHNWTGNFLEESSSELRFYGSGQLLWFNTTSDGFNWNGYTNTNLTGGDPTVVKAGLNAYLIIYTGEPYPTGVTENKYEGDLYFPNPVKNTLFVKRENSREYTYAIYSTDGKILLSGRNADRINAELLPPGEYILVVSDLLGSRYNKFIKQ
jgi:hypothetical protein